MCPGHTLQIHVIACQASDSCSIFQILRLSSFTSTRVPENEAQALLP